MDEKEKVIAIAEAFMRLEAEIEARGALLERCWNRPGTPWSSVSFDLASKTLNGQEHHSRLAELRRASNAASDGDSLIHILHREILRKSTV